MIQIMCPKCNTKQNLVRQYAPGTLKWLHPVFGSGDETPDGSLIVLGCWHAFELVSRS